MSKRILILGGYGNIGFLIAKLLLQESDVQLVIAGRHLSQAQQAANKLNHEFYGDRVSVRQVNAAHINSLETGLKRVDMIVVASSTVEFVHNVASQALKAGIDYLDVQLSSPQKLAVLNGLREEIEQQGRCFITDSGLHPGIPGAMVRYAATQFDQLEVANVSAVFQLNWKQLPFSESTTAEFMDELMNFNPLVLKHRQWIEMDIKRIPRFNFGNPFGKRYCPPMFLEELRSLPNTIPSLNETGFYIAGFNWMTDYIIMPIAFTAFKIFRQKAHQPMKHLFLWGLKRFSQPPYGAIVQLEAKGLKDQQKTSMHLKLIHDDAYIFTAISTVACLLQYLNNRIRHPGLWFQANVVQPQYFLYYLKRLGVKVELQITQQ